MPNYREIIQQFKLAFYNATSATTAAVRYTKEFNKAYKGEKEQTNYNYRQIITGNNLHKLPHTANLLDALHEIGIIILPFQQNEESQYVTALNADYEYVHGIIYIKTYKDNYGHWMAYTVNNTGSYIHNTTAPFFTKLLRNRAYNTRLPVIYIKDPNNKPKEIKESCEMYHSHILGNFPVYGFIFVSIYDNVKIACFSKVTHV